MYVLQKLTDKQGGNSRVPLCVDLDGTLITSDVLYESVVALVRQNVLYIFLIPWWVLGGRAYFKAQVASRVKIDPATLPYRQDVLEYLREKKASGHFLVLATASHRNLVVPIAEHLELFDEVIATDGPENLRGKAKLRVLQERYGQTGFDYIGDSHVDLAVWQGARHVYLVQPSRRLRRRAEAFCKPHRIFHVPSRKWRARLKALRPHQWAKNLLLFVPLVLAHQISDLTKLTGAFLGFLAFCLFASAVYILNDLLDMHADRLHPKKKHRPFAAGTLSIPSGLVLLLINLIAGTILLLIPLPPTFLLLLLLYLVVTTAYSLFLKRQPMIDVFVLAGLYTLRILAGGVAAEVEVTGWLLAFSMFFFISLALVKRFAELSRAELEKMEKLDHRGYWTEDLSTIQSIGPACGYMAVLTMCLYMNSERVREYYHTPQLLWIICFVIFYWITRVWFLARRRQLNEDPLVFAVTDPMSYLCGLIVTGVLIVASASALAF